MNEQPTITTPIKRNFRDYALPVGLSLAVGLTLSPAFFLGSLAKTRRSLAVTAGLGVLWGAFKWVSLQNDRYIYPGASAAFQARYDRIDGVQVTDAFANAVVLTACCYLAGLIARHLFDRHRAAFVPLAMACAAFGAISFGQHYVAQADVDYAEASGGESGRLEVISKSTAVQAAIIGQLAVTDREKLLVAYTQRIIVGRGFGITVEEPRFDEFIGKLADSCAGAQDELPLCRNKILDDIRKTQKALPVASGRN